MATTFLFAFSALGMSVQEFTLLDSTYLKTLVTGLKVSLVLPEYNII